MVRRLLLPAVVLVLIAIVGVLQLRTARAVAESERERLRTAMTLAARSFAREALGASTTATTDWRALALRHFGEGEELYCRVAVVRTGDRSIIYASDETLPDDVAVEMGDRMLLVGHRNGSIEQVTSPAMWQNVIASMAMLALLAAAIALLLRAERRERALMAGITHELNTPIAAIGAVGQNLADGVVADPEQVRRYGAAIAAEASRLRQTVGNVLAAARGESRVVATSVVDVDALIDDALADLRWLLEQRDFEVIRERCGARVLVDREQLRAAVRNLVENAVKYSPEVKEIRAGASVQDGSVVIHVADRGIGLDAGDAARIGTPFFRGARARRQPAGGAGLGLALVRSVARAHGGRLTVERREDGTTFSLVLRGAAASAVEPA